LKFPTAIDENLVDCLDSYTLHLNLYNTLFRYYADNSKQLAAQAIEQVGTSMCSTELLPPITTAWSANSGVKTTGRLRVNILN